MKQFVGEIFDPVKNFYIMRKWTESLMILLFSIVIGILCYLVASVFKLVNITNLHSFVNDIINQLITVLALFVSFSMAYLSILITSSSDNVKEIKGNNSKKYKIKNKYCTLYQVILSEITYILVIEIFFLIIVFGEKFLMYLLNSFFLKIMISVNIAFFSHVLFMLLIVIKDIYYIFWKSK